MVGKFPIRCAVAWKCISKAANDHGISRAKLEFIMKKQADLEAMEKAGKQMKEINKFCPRCKRIPLPKALFLPTPEGVGDEGSMHAECKHTHAIPN